MANYYFDHAATSPMHPDVIAAMVEVMQEGPVNPSSVHLYGRKAKMRLNQARDIFANHLGCKPNEITFTSGGTESDNFAIIGGARAQAKLNRKHLITSAIEHHAVLNTMQWLKENEGFELTVLPVDEYGYISLKQLEAALRSDTALVSIMHANNEVGTLQPIVEIGELVKQSGALLHVDAVQSLGYEQYHLASMPIDLMSFSSHKLNGPQGVGALYIANTAHIESTLFGGKQERKRRAGTENVAGIVGFAKALDISVNNKDERKLYDNLLRNTWIKLLSQELNTNQIIVNSPLESPSLPNIVNISFIGADTESLLMNLDIAGVAISSGSACTSGSLERSHVLTAMGLPEDRLNSAVRFSFGLGNTKEELVEAAKIVATNVKRLTS